MHSLVCSVLFEWHFVLLASDFVIRICHMVTSSSSEKLFKFCMDFD